jgi:hypothetical protein
MKVILISALHLIFISLIELGRNNRTYTTQVKE